MGAGVVAAAIALGLFLHLRPAGAAAGYELNVRLPKTDGLSKGSEVRISGVKVGTVSDLTLDPVSYLATVRMNIQDDVRVPSDSALEVTSGGLLGNLYVAIFPGKWAEELLLFAAPPPGAGDLQLELPGSAFGSHETVRLKLPEFWLKSRQGKKLETEG